jgi:hypothetical protein
VVAKGSDSRQQEIESDQPEEEKKPLTLREKQKQERLAQHITVRLSSGETRLIHKDCCATVGVASNPNYHYTQLGKAGRSRWLNIRPTVRGLAMNAMDHPHGGGRGKSKGNVDPKSPWGIPVSSFPSLIDLLTMSKLLIREFFLHCRPSPATRPVPSGRSTRPWCTPDPATRVNAAVDTTSLSLSHLCLRLPVECCTFALQSMLSPHLYLTPIISGDLYDILPPCFFTRFGKYCFILSLVGPQAEGALYSKMVQGHAHQMEANRSIFVQL